MAILDEFAGLSQSARDLAYAIAVSGDPVEIELPIAIASLDEAQGVELLDELLAAQLVVEANGPRSFRFRHPVIAAVIYRSIPAGGRIALHTAAAKWLASVGADVVTIARHLECSPTVGDFAAVATIEAAVEQCRVTSPPTQARLLASALRLVPTGEQFRPQRLGLIFQRVDCLVRQGRYELALTEIDQGITLAGDDASALAMFTAARSTVEAWLDRPETTQADFLRLLARLPQTAVMERMLLQMALTFVAGIQRDLDTMRTYGKYAYELAESINLPVGQFNVSAALSYLEIWNGDLVAAQSHGRTAREILDALPPSELAMASDGLQVFVAVQYQFASPDLMTYARLGSEVSAKAGNRVQECRYGLAAESQMTPMGKLAAVTALLEDLEQLAESIGYELGVALISARQAVVAALSADWEGCDKALQRVPDELLTRTLESNFLGLAAEISSIKISVAFVCSLAGRWKECRKILLPLVGQQPTNRLSNPILPIAYEMLTLADLEKGDMAAAKAWAQQAVRLDDHIELVNVNVYGQRSLAAVAVAEGDFELALVAAQSAIDGALQADSVLDAARARIVYSQALAASGRNEEAVQVAELALADVQSCGAWRIAEEATEQLRSLGVPIGKTPTRGATGTQLLTAREQEVAVMVAAGLRNQEIAARPFLSTRTVESHLRRIFTKLGVESRVQLIREIERHRIRPPL